MFLYELQHDIKNCVIIQTVVNVKSLAHTKRREYIEKN